MGDAASKASQQLFEAHLYDDYLHFHGLSVETAEALAEMLHKKMDSLGIAPIEQEEIINQNFNQSGDEAAIETNGEIQ